jgi:phosphopantetheinyl transferase
MVSPGEIHIWGSAVCSSLPALLELALGRPREYAVAETGKPYLTGAPGLNFNIARTSGLAVIAVAVDVEVGIDVERLRPIPEWEDIASKYFPAVEVADERAFFRQWVRFEAQVKARAAGLLQPSLPCPTVEDLDFGGQFAAAVAATAPHMSVKLHWGNR